MTCKQVRGWLLSVGTCAFLWMIAASPARGNYITIDDFDLPDTGTAFVLPLLHGNLWHHADTVAGDSVLGHEREVLIRVDPILPSYSIVAVGVIGVDRNVDRSETKSVNGVFAFGGQDFGKQANTGGIVTLTYDGSGTGTLNSTDLTDGGANTGIELRFGSSNGVVSEGLKVDVTATSSLGGALTYSGRVPNSAFPTKYYIPYAGFTPQGDASFNTLDSLKFVFNGDKVPNVDFNLDIVTAVPEPSTLALLGLGLLILIGRSLRHRLGR